ncbi:uncharacterized protein LOC109842290, partial [Asparagus officinalis]|uniref:uncharacterized protein LOC109842290 n=1 Tax=Asparagus officinalis TaxID=4686 RepID=UPI00098E7853
RLRIFLFSHHNPDPDAAAAVHFDVDERETERRYVDALNSLADNEIQDQFFGPGLHQLNIPHSHSRYGEDGPWSPAYFSPSPGRDLREFPNSPSSARYNDPAAASQFDQQSPPLVDNTMWLPPGAIVQEKAGFPGNLGHAHNMFDGGNSTCEHCRIGYQRSQVHVSDPRYLDPRWNQPAGGNEYMGQISGSCADCYRNREQPFYNEAHGHDRGWHLHPHQGSHRVEDPRMHQGGRMGDHYVVDGNMMNVPFAHGNFYDGRDDGRYHRPTPTPVNEFGGEVFPGQQAVGHGSHHPSQFGAENPHQMPTNLPPIQNLRRRAQGPVWSGAPYDPPGPLVANGFVRSAHDGSPRVPHIGVDDQVQGTWNGQNGSLPQKYYGVDDHGARMNPNLVNQERIIVASEVSLGTRLEEVKQDDMKVVKPTEVAKVVDANANVDNERWVTSPECLTYLPKLIASVKNVALEGAEEVKAKAEANPEDKKEPSPNELGAGVSKNGQAELEAETDGDIEKKDISKIEPTTAEAEALAQGLQTIKNDDLEEIRELGSGTYGSVYHGKWKGSDVAIKRIKASCFNGKPSERERLIADFWKEALTLSSLHHPNVVSFYGVVRDGPDGSLATVTEFMVNGSLKQFLQKKDSRTIDRRKRLIIAMDAAFGMEYLHGKNIVHFDLKCENLLVNMRDPQRPICKIGDLGLSKVKQRTLVSGGVRGTLPWMAPELLSGKNIMVTEKVDVYSFGIVMWELLTGEEPYGDMHCGSIIGGIMSNSLRPQIPTWCDPEWKSLMESCWSSDPGQRPSFAEISQKLRKMAAAINVK